MIEEALGAAAYGRLAPALQRFHRLAGRHQLSGWVETSAPETPAARGMAWLLGTPSRSDSGPIRFELDAQPREESWTRHFPSRVMRSRMLLVGQGPQPQIVEQLGPVRLGFTLREVQGRFEMQLQRLRMLGLPCPRWLMPAIVAHETGEGDQLHFHIEARLPLLGLVARYRGHLAVPAVPLAPSMPSMPAAPQPSR